MTLKTVVSKIKKNFFTCNFFPLIFRLLPSPVITGQKRQNFVSWEGVKTIGVTKSNVFAEFVMTLLASTRVFHKKGKLIFDFCHILRSFCRCKIYSR